MILNSLYGPAELLKCFKAQLLLELYPPEADLFSLVLSHVLIYLKMQLHNLNVLSSTNF